MYCILYQLVYLVHVSVYVDSLLTELYCTCTGNDYHMYTVFIPVQSSPCCPNRLYSLDAAGPGPGAYMTCINALICTLFIHIPGIFAKYGSLFFGYFFFALLMCIVICLWQVILEMIVSKH